MVDINTATQQELEAVKGVGAATAKKIIAGRPYKSLDELTKAGLTAKKIKALKPFVAVGKAAAAPATAPAAEKKPKAAPAVKPAEKKAPATTPAPAAAAAPVDLNTADQKALESLPGIGPALAKKIVAGRPFKSVDDLSRIKGMTTSKIDAIKDKVTVAAAKPLTPTPTPAAAKPQATPAPVAAAAPVDLNTADQKALESLPGIGPALAKKIMEGRPFKSVDDLSRIKGMTKAKIDAIKDKVMVAAAKPLTPAPAPAAAKPQATPAPAAAAPVDLNTADQKALESLPGIGPALAKKIMEGRPFKSVDDLSRIKGMTKAKIDAIKDKVTVAAAKPLPPTPAPAAAKPAPAPAAPAATPPATPAVEKKEAVPSKEAPAATKLAPGEKVNINTASKEDLDKLWGIGDVKSQAIIEGRPYEKIEDIMKVKGIKEGEFGRIKDLITVK
jgi:competence protein ComEA